MRYLGVLILSFGMALWVAVLLWAWGWDEIGTFFGHPARTGVVVLFGIGGAVGVVAMLRGFEFGLMTKPQERRRDPLWYWVAMLGAVWFLLWFLPYADRRGLLVFPQSDLVRYMGLAVFIVGGVMRSAARLTLGARHLPVVGRIEGHQLQTEGIYRSVRNPSYLGGIILSLGLALIFRSWAGVLVALGVLLLVRFRLRTEEAFLEEHFGDEWRDYAARTPRFMPRLRPGPTC